MHDRRRTAVARPALAIAITACAASTSTRPPADPHTTAPPRTAAADDDPVEILEPPATPPTPEPAGASLSLRRTACFGACPAYTVTLFENGVVVYEGSEFVTVIGEARRVIDPAIVVELLGQADAVFARKGLPVEHVACTTDMPAVVLTMRRGDAVAERWVSSSCTTQFGGDSTSAMRKRMRERGLDYDAFVAAEAFADDIDRAVPTATWVDDPACRDLRGTLLGPVLADDSGSGVEDRPNELEAWMLDRIRRDASVSLRLRTLAGSDEEAVMAHRARLLARGVPRDRLVVERMMFPTNDFALKGIDLTIGPTHCFAAARAIEAALAPAP